MGYPIGVEYVGTVEIYVTVGAAGGACVAGTNAGLFLLLQTTQLKIILLSKLIIKYKNTITITIIITINPTTTTKKIILM
jgi:hypothetical protein